MGQGPSFEPLLDGTLRAGVVRELPDHPDATASAVAAGRAAYESGASLAAARSQALSFAACWARHPSHARDRRIPVALRAS